MDWTRLLGRTAPARPASVEFPVRVDLEDPRLTVTIHLHEIETAGGALSCWSYVTSGLSFWGHKEIVWTVKREPHEAVADYPTQPIEILAAIAPLARDGTLADAGETTRFEPKRGPFGGQVLYVPAQPLAGVPVPEGALAAVVITDEELETVLSHGATRVMARLGREAAYFPCPPWSDRARLRSAEPVVAPSILDRAPRVAIPGVSAIYDGRNVSIFVTDESRPRLRRAMEEWSVDQLAVILTGMGRGDGCLVWDPGLNGLNAITPPNSTATRLAACFLMIGGEQPANEIRLVEDGIFLILTHDSTVALRDALMNARDLRLTAADDAVITVAAGDEPGAPEPTVGILALYPETEWVARGVDSQSLTDYINEMLLVVGAERRDDRLPARFDIFVVLRGGVSRVWGAPPDVCQRLEAVSPPAVDPGPFAFVLVALCNGEMLFDIGRDSPAEWSAAAAQIPSAAVTIDDVIAQVWPA